MPKPTPPTISHDQLPEYNAALKQRGSLEVWFDPRMNWFSVPRGRPLRFSDRRLICV